MEVAIPIMPFYKENVKLKALHQLAKTGVCLKVAIMPIFSRVKTVCKDCILLDECKKAKFGTAFSEIGKNEIRRLL